MRIKDGFRRVIEKDQVNELLYLMFAGGGYSVGRHVIDYRAI